VLRGKWQEGLDHLQLLLPRSPMSMPLREKIAELITQIEGEDAAIAHWREATEEFPHFQPLAERYAMSLRVRPLEEIQPVLEKILDQTPTMRGPFANWLNICCPPENSTKRRS